MDDPVSNTSNDVGKGAFSCIPRHVQLRIYLYLSCNTGEACFPKKKGGKRCKIHQQTFLNGNCLKLECHCYTQGISKIYWFSIASRPLMRQGYSLLTSEMFDTYEISGEWLPTLRPNRLESLGRLQTRAAVCERGVLSHCSVSQPAFLSRHVRAINYRF